MYCIKCGVRLADTEKSCPLCRTRVYHPELIPTPAPGLYPQNHFPPRQRHSKSSAIALTAIGVLALTMMLICDLQIHAAVTWSGYGIGALAVFYVAFVLPLWFSRPNPVIFVPCSFAAAAGYLLYINCMVGGSWFLPFALPVTGGTAIIVTALVTVLRYVPRGKLYTVGGSLLATGGFMLLVEFLLSRTFCTAFVGWSFYPLTTLTLLGGYLIFLGICRPAREAMARKFFF